MTNSSELWDKKQKKKHLVWAHCALSCASQEAAFSVCFLVKTKRSS